MNNLTDAHYASTVIDAENAIDRQRALDAVPAEYLDWVTGYVSVALANWIDQIGDEHDRHMATLTVPVSIWPQVSRQLEMSRHARQSLANSEAQA